MTLDSEDIQCIYWARRLVAEPQKALEDIIELRNICVLLFDAVKHGNQVVDLPGIWNKAEEVLRRTDPEDKP